MKKPILACAGRTSASIDAELLNELLLNYHPLQTHVMTKAANLSHKFDVIAKGEYDEIDALEEFKAIITREFLSMQLAEAVNLARKLSLEDYALASADEEECL
jgi:hypothetical protein